jgi:hypothetical protein
MKDDRNIEDSPEREERDARVRRERSEAERDPGPVEAAEEHRRRPGDDAFSDDEMVERARR